MQYVAARKEVGHESMGYFAILLSQPEIKGTEVYYRWRDAFPVVCNATLEEVCKAKQSSLDDLILFH